MGNNPSTITPTPTENNLEKLKTELDEIATQLILTTNFQDMLKLREPKYSDKLVILTRDAIFEKLQNQIDIEKIKYRVSKPDGSSIKETEIIAGDMDSFIKVLRDNLTDKDQKKELAMGLAQYYIKIAHIYSAIVTTLNPSFTFKNDLGESISVSLKNKDSVPEGFSKTLEETEISICIKRIKVLANEQNYELKENIPIIVNPKFCDININNKKTQASQNVVTNTLIDEPGILELEKLYYDVYNYDSGKYDSMSDKQKNRYKQDLKTFYTAFTGNSKEMPSDITKFADIKLANYHDSEGCRKDINKIGSYKKSYTGSKDQQLFVDYANHIKKMITDAKNNQAQLLSIIDKLFIKKNNTWTIMPNIVEKLDTITDDTIKLISNVYTQCQNDFNKGIEIFTQIVIKKIKEMEETSVQQSTERIARLAAEISTPITNSDKKT